MNWYQVGDIQEDDGDVGGDIQCGKAASVRFALEDKPGSLVTVYLYPIRHYANDGCRFVCKPGAIDLEEQIEFLVCEDPKDPGGTEVWSDYVYDMPLADEHGRGMDFSNVEQAESAALRLIKLHGPEYVSWNGEAPWGTEEKA